MGRDNYQECASAIAKISANMPPLVNKDLSSWLASYDGLSGAQSAIEDGKKIDNVDSACSAMMTTPTPPDSLTSAASSYFSRLESWQSSIAPSVTSAAARCTGDGVVGLAGAGLELIVATDVAQCTNALNKYNKAVSAANTGAPRYFVAIAGAVGVAAAVVLL
jgi:hypothetical protein